MTKARATDSPGSGMHSLSDWAIVGIIVVSYAVGYICALLAHKDDILH